MDRQLLARATENSDAPTPGYMYNDIAKNAASNPAVCSDVAKYLTGRLASKNNYNIKHKCLKVIAKTATSPYLRGQFKRCLSIDPQAMGAIKDALQFRGPPDPVRGDEPYERVRVAAKEALGAIYSDTPADQSAGGSFASAASSSYGPSAGQQGFSSSQGYGSSSNPGGREMEGIGNPMFKDPRLGSDTPNPALVNAINDAKDTIIGMIKDPLARNPTVGANAPRSSYGGGGGGYSSSGSYNPQSSYPPGRSELMHETNGQWTMKSNRGPEAVGPPPNYQSDSAYYKSRDSGNAYAWAQKSGGSSSGVGGSWASSAPNVASQARQPSYAEHHQSTPSITISGGTTNLSGGGGTALADGSYEKQLILELCPPGGMKAEPPPDKLNSFARSVSSLNPDLVCPVLLDCLEDGQPWIIRAKALCVMECCIRNGQKPGAPGNPYSDFFHACGAEIAPLAIHPRAAIKDPTKRVLGLLRIAVPVGGSAAHQPPAAAPPNAAPIAAPAPALVPNLLDFGDTIEPAKPPPEQPPPPPPAQGNSLFGGLTVAGPSVPAPAPAAPPAAPSSGNLLGDLTSGTDQAPSAPSGQNMFGDLNVKSVTPAANNEVTQATSMFESLHVKSEETKTEVIAPAPSASAFGFMNQAAGTETTTAKTEETRSASAVPASWDSFDPLNSNVTPNTAKKMAQVSPEQMQALAYQKMIMQQQMQMAQMMAMQQQRGQPGMFPQMPGVMPGSMVMQNPAAARTSFAFLDGESQKKDDKSFDFVKDAITMEKKK